MNAELCDFIDAMALDKARDVLLLISFDIFDLRRSSASTSAARRVMKADVCKLRLASQRAPWTHAKKASANT